MRAFVISVAAWLALGAASAWGQVRELQRGTLAAAEAAARAELNARDLPRGFDYSRLVQAPRNRAGNMEAVIDRRLLMLNEKEQAGILAQKVKNVTVRLVVLDDQGKPKELGTFRDVPGGLRWNANAKRLLATITPEEREAFAREQNTVTDPKRGK